jgi:neutral ceramidase
MTAPPTTFRAGAAATNVDPPLGLPLVGVVRRSEPARERLGPLEVTAAAFELGSTRVVVCGVDTLAIQSPEVDAIRDRVAAATGATRAGVLLNWNHTHHAPPGGRSVYGSFGERDPEPDGATLAYVERLHDAIVATCAAAFERLEDAAVRSGLGRLEAAVNRRQRDPDGMVRTIGWNPGGLVDLSVPVLQSVRRDGSPIATIVGYGAHTVTTGVEYVGYSPDYPGWLRESLRELTGGEVVYLQGAAGNVMPLHAFDDSLAEPPRLGRLLALEAAHAVAGRPAWPERLVETGFTSGTPLALFRLERLDGPPPALAAAEEAVDFPLLPLPSPAAVEAALADSERELAEAEARGATEGELRILRFHGRNWARRTAAELAGPSPRTSVAGAISALRIGDAAIVTGPGEVFTEIGLAVKERSPADVTFYAGYSNGCVSYLPTASEYPLGGYEPSYGNKTYGLPVQVAPEADRLLVETGVRLVRSLFPEREAPDVEGWLATGAEPRPPAAPPLERPPLRG